MGMPFPAGLRYVDQFRPELSQWAWGINACATVMGSGICILISSSLGFRAALIFSSLVYLSGWLVLTTSQRDYFPAGTLVKVKPLGSYLTEGSRLSQSPPDR
jgi:hypothetical protein